MQEDTLSAFATIALLMQGVSRQTRHLSYNQTMKNSVYVESSVISYLTARPSRDVVKAARQAITEDWWENERERFDVFVSALVEEEISQGNAEAAQKRLDAASEIANLTISEEAQRIAQFLLDSGAVPANSTEDALHIGIAAAEGAHFLLTWNFKHINNAETKALITSVIEQLGYESPILCSPEELGGSK